MQIRKDAASWSPLQLSAEEFAENVRQTRARATSQATPSGPGTADRE